MKKIAIIGSGSWGVALGIHLSKLGHKVNIWSFMQEEADLINNERKCKFLPEVTIPDGVYCTTSYEETIKDSEVILHVTPSKFTRDTVKQYKKYITDQIVVICTKGFEKESLSTLDEVMKQEIPGVKLAVLSRTKSCRRSIKSNTYSNGNCIRKSRNIKLFKRYFYERKLKSIYF